ncbi:CoA protein activase [Heliorestis acidaminivorans]|uniref:CoA protein activase n=1 Tax=Heliorestis acidaminivorans TaxID=553427 RepID=A0A6I0F3K0_9FIRM|nr:2-hydroxyacyl-CoA dehydratase [Heliorestis acidaminivorans]KAB2951710.1 CoA protein activase [Heliorestis acidaminivorans]
MKITFPHMGNMDIVIKALLGELGHEVITPPPITKRTLSLGVQYSPEFACLPLKVNIGNFIEAVEKGADTVIMAGGIGPCRFGYYNQVQREILQDMGVNLNMVVLEPPDQHIGELLKRLRIITGSNSWWKLIKAIRFAYEKCLAIDALEKEASRLRCRELQRGDVDRVYQKGQKAIDQAKTVKEVRRCKEEYIKAFNSLTLDWQKKVIKIGLVGEIYTLLEPTASGYMEKHLGYLGAEVDRSLYLSEWVNEHLFKGLLPVKGHQETRKLAKPYLSCIVGGHGQESIGGAIEYAKKGFDGVIQVGPLTCMPEIVAQSIMPLVEKEYGLPVLTIYTDEQTGEAGLITRLEAFIDMLERKKIALGQLP